MNSFLFICLVFVLAVLDIIYTYYNVKILKRFKSTWGNTEHNPLVRSSWHHFGLLKGTIIASLATLSGMIVLAVVIGENEFFQGVLVGLFLMLHHIHFVNYAYISRKYLKKEPPIIGKIIMEW